MGILRTIPNMTIVNGCDYYSTRKLVRAAAYYQGPVYLRFTRDAVPFVYDETEAFEFGKAKVLKDGSDITIIANGDVMSRAYEAADLLEEKGISVRLLDMHTIKPLDTESVLDALKKTGRVITVEDHNVINGLGSAVCEVASEAGKGIVKRVGIQDQFGQSAPYERLLEMNGITVENIVAIAEKLTK